MADEQKPGLVRLSDRRDEIVRQLGVGFANDLLDEDDLERRVALAHAATNVAALEELVRDLEIAPSPQTSMLAPVAPKITALFGNVERRGPLALPGELEAKATFGSVVLDLRDAQLQPGMTTLHVNATFGNVEIIVPPDVAVACDGQAVFGNFSQKRLGKGLPEVLQRVVNRIVGAPDEDEIPSGDRPLLRVVGRALFASVEVKVRSRGTKKARALSGKTQKALPAKE